MGKGVLGNPAGFTTHMETAEGYSKTDLCARSIVLITLRIIASPL